MLTPRSGWIGSSEEVKGESIEMVQTVTSSQTLISGKSFLNNRKLTGVDQPPAVESLACALHVFPRHIYNLEIQSKSFFVYSPIQLQNSIQTLTN